MHILPINKTVTEKKPAFRGLWGNTQTRSVRKENYSMDNIILHYYPFKDESKESVENVVKRNSFEYTASWFETGGKAVDYSKSVKVHYKLPFTRREYLAYKAAALAQNTISGTEKFVYEILKSRKLNKYLIPELPEKPLKKNFFRPFQRVIKF